MKTLTALVLSATQAWASPSPFYNSPGPDIPHERAYMFSQIPPGSCLRGTYVSADIAALVVPKIMVAPDAEFWIHMGQTGNQAFFSSSPWAVSPRATEMEIEGLKPAFQMDIRAKLKNNDFITWYGRDLYKFGYKPCK